MKKICYSLLAAMAVAANVRGDILAEWNFNSNPPDTAVNTGTTNTSLGIGMAGLVGGATATFATGSTAVDPAGTTDNSGWNTAGYPAQGAGNKTRGVQFAVSTEGYESIVVTWEHRNSNTASRYGRFQYSLDGVNFVDFAVIAADPATANSFVSRSVSLNSIVGANNNPNFAFRIVAEFESTATGAGSDQYAATATGSAYASGGTWRLDMVTVSGSPPDGNANPTITAIGDQSIRANTSTDALPFQVGDVETPPELLSISGSASNPTLVPEGGIFFTGEGSSRFVTVTPDFDQTGTSTITLYVIDGGGKSNSTSFVLTVLPDNTAPTLSALTNVHTVIGSPFAPINFTISDLETPADNLNLVVFSSNQGIIPDANLSITGSSSDRTLTITPTPGQTGNAMITVTVSDGALSATRSFNAMVVPSTSVVLSEPFEYADGSLTTNSGGLWANHSGIFGQMDVLGGVLQVTSSDSEDASARLIGAPYDTSSGTVLYASFTANFSALPSATGDYFAHFREILGAFRARIYATTSNSTIGFYRFGLANNNANLANGLIHPTELSVDTPVLVVVRYDVAAGTSTLWVNPTSEGDVSISPTDNISPAPIYSFAFRQSGGVGDLRVDNLLVGLSFDAVMPGLLRLSVARNGNNVEISWPSSATAEGYNLESTTSLSEPDWQPVGPSTPSGDRDVVVITNPSGNEFFRLKKP